MTKQPAPANVEPARDVVCPSCGRVTNAVSICRFCWQPLAAQEAADRGLEVSARTARGPRREYVRRGVYGLTVALVALLVYRLWFAAPSPLPSPQSTERSVVSGPTSWPAANGDTAATRATDAPAALAGNVAWRVSLEASASTPVVASEHALFVGLTNGTLAALDSASGNVLWTAAVPGQLDAAPAIAGNEVYAAYRDGRVVALDAGTGREIWTASAGSSTLAPLIADGVVYAASQRAIHAFDAETGRRLWMRDLEGGWSPASPVAAGPQLVVARHDQVVVFDRTTGEQTFFYKARTPQALTVAGSRVVLVAADRAVAFGIDERRPWWEGFRRAWGQFYLWGVAPPPPNPPRDWLAPAPRGALPVTVAGSALVIATRDGSVSALDLASGAELWATRRGPLMAPPVATANGVLLVEPDALVTLDGVTGVELARRDLAGGRLGSAIVTAHGTYVLASGGQELLALR